LPFKTTDISAFKDAISNETQDDSLTLEEFKERISHITEWAEEFDKLPANSVLQQILSEGSHLRREE
jgi:beta-lactam-binding protein with PASTA domain